jgi:hypothetical protein
MVKAPSSGQDSANRAMASQVRWRRVIPRPPRGGVEERHQSTGMIRVNTMTSLKALAQNEEKDSSRPTSNAPTTASG